MHLRFLHVSFCDLTAHFFLALNNAPLSGPITACLPLHPLKDILVAFSFFTIADKASVKILMQVFVWTSLQCIWINTREHDHWSVW